MRLFAALLPPEDATAELAVAVEKLRALPGSGALRWTERANWHFTLAFYGEVEEPLLPALRERLARVATRAQPLELRLAGGGRFGDRALWAGLGAAPAALESVRRLAGASAAAGRKAGIAMAKADRYRFRAHLTVARTRSRHAEPGSELGAEGVGLGPYAAALDAFSGAPWTAGELVLVRSNLPVSGVPGQQPRYESVEGWPLGR